ncbi:hypothetical protein RintRC_1105 [Richelia intracellularis]|nr:hypothetical protein RintRC_1105 [Richelia intracellularis]
MFVITNMRNKKYSQKTIISHDILLEKLLQNPYATFKKNLFILIAKNLKFC